MNNAKYKNRGFVGLCNLGNTCFLNSCIQVLNHTYELHDLIDRARYDREVSSVLKEWVDLKDLMWNGENGGVVAPHQFIRHVQCAAREKGRDIFTGWVQNDITEFLLFLIDCFHTTLARKTGVKIGGTPENGTDRLAIECYRMLESVYKREHSVILELFYGIYVSTITDITGGELYSVRPEHYFVLDLQIFSKDRMFSNLYECMDAFTSPEMMSGENAWFNEKTGGKEDIWKGVCFWSFPKILVLTLKRFSADGMQKVNTHVDFPLDNLDLSRYVRGYNPSSYTYDLFGVCNHSGGCQGGHYTAYVKNASDQWVHYNDDHVSIIENTHVVSPMAYCLFYRKK
uniref:USP domain-containing protein n=1 Tax=viral metagenome TaxID=1070528 RepID=A0A6C0DXX9_9ZZZZ